jgi:molybdate transport system substrate-binding protein
MIAIEKLLWGAILFSLGLLGVLVAAVVDRQPTAKRAGGNAEPLVVYCAASNKSVLEAIRADYEKAFGTPLQVQYGASQTLLAALEVAKAGDLYLPADDSYLAMARDRHLIAEEFPLAIMQPVVAVAKGNPKQIKNLADLLRPDVRVSQASPEAAAIGKLTRETLTASGQWDQLHAHTTVYKTTVNEVANDVKVGAVDAGIVYDAVLHDYDTLESVAIPEFAKTKSQVAVAVLKASKQPRQALHLARFLSARDKGLARYREFGFQPVEGDAWTEQPELTLYAGSMLRPAIERTITAFEEREGVRVTRIYNGCGILVAQMKAGQVPDAYFACDSEFMNQVQPLFDDRLDVSQNELVIMVKKGNPFGIRSLSDLTKPNLRVGIGHEKQCAMGWLTQRTFAESGLQTQLMKNVVVQTPTGDMLVNQMRSGSLDAAVAYISNAAGAVDFLDAIRIQGIPCSVATQPFAVAKDSANSRLAARLLAAIRAKESQERFTTEGFRWIEVSADRHE